MRHPEAIQGVVLCGATLLAYLNALHGVFQFDDYNVIVDNPAVHSWGAWTAGLGGIRPLLKATYTLNWCLGGSPLGFHLFNLGIHCANVLMVFALARRLFGRGPDAGSRGGWAFSVALLFALHPLQTEAVTYICGRSSSLMAFFYLGSLLAYLRGSWVWRGGISPLLFILALLSKETALTLPFALALWEATEVEGRPRPLRGPWVHWGLLACFCLFLGLHGGYRHLLGASFGARGVGDNLLSQISAIAYLFGKWAWPLHLNIDPWLPALHAWTGLLVFQALLLGSFLALGLWHLQRRPWLAFGALWCVLQLLPTNSLVPRLDVVNERQFYLASMGASLCLVGGLGTATAKWRRFHRPLWGVVGLGLLGLTLLRNRDYRSEIALWTSSVKVGPHNPRAYNNLGCANAYAGQPSEARQAFEAALRLDPSYARARANLAIVDRQREGPSP